MLKGRKVLVFPDIDAYAAWQEAFAKKPFLSVTFSDILEKEGTPEDRAAQIDIADWLLRCFCHPERSEGSPQPDGTLCPVPPVPERNKDLARFFSPESLPEVAALIEDLDLEIVSIIPPQTV